MNDIWILGGTVIDMVTGEERARDICVTGGVLDEKRERAAQVIDARGMYVVPGLIDIHAHIWPLMHLGVRAEAAYYPSGVTYIADAGSAGWVNWRDNIGALAGLSIGVKSFINVSPLGLGALNAFPEDIDPAHWDERAMTALAREYPREIAGFKIRVGRETVRELGMRPLERAVKLARDANSRLMVHPAGSDIPMRDILSALGAGDIFTHTFHGKGESILGEGGLKAALDAQARGVILDIGDAGGHFNFDVFRRAREAGLRADTLGSDVTQNGLYKKYARAFSLTYCMSRQLSLGAGMAEVIRMTTIAPARALGIDGEAGTLDIGRRADVAVLKRVNAPMRFDDGAGKSIEGDTYLRTMLTLKSGAIMYRDIEI